MESASNNQTQSSYIQPHILRKYNVLKKVGSGAYGHVWKVQDRLTQKIYALKKIFDAFQHSTDAQRTYRQIQILRQTQHPNIIRLVQTIKADNNKDVYLVFDFMQADLHNVIAEGILKDVHIKYIVYQLAKALKYLHSGKVIHRDLKPSNILINSNCFIKLCDFGLVRSLSLNDQSIAPTLTEGVATRWYRAPQVLLGSKSYSVPADIWSFGCIVYEILAEKPLFPGNSTIDQVDKILMLTGIPSQQDIQSLQSQIAKSMLKQSKVSYSSQKINFYKQFDPLFVDFLNKILVFNPNKRIGIEQILEHDLVKPFRKKQQEIQCKKQIRTSVDDNKKLTVQQYRNFIYGVKRSTTPNYFPKNQLIPKKSNSYGKLASGTNIKSTLSQKETKQKQTLKFARSAKDVMRSMHSYNKSTQLPQTQTSYHTLNKNTHVPQRQTQYQYTMKPHLINRSGPIVNQKYTNYQQQIRHTLGSPPTANFFNSPKSSSTGQTQNKQIYKSSKYVISKNEGYRKLNEQI